MQDNKVNATNDVVKINDPNNDFYDESTHFPVNLKIRHNKKLIIAVTIVIVLAVAVFFLIKFLILPYQQSFKLNEAGYSYQITKCWKTNPPSYWVKRLKNGDNNSSVKIGSCSFQGVGAIKIKDTKLNFDELLNRNLTIQGNLIKEGLVNYYQLTAAVLETSSPDSNYLTKGMPKKPEEQLVIKRIVANGEEIIYKRPKNDDHRIVMWQNYLIYEPIHGYSSNDKLVRYDLDTGKLETIYKEDNQRRYLNDLQIIDDTLFFSVAGYLAGSDTFWMKTPMSVPQKLKYGAEFGAGSIEFHHGRYWLSGGEGDGCWGVRNFALFNPKTRYVTPVVTSNYGCAEGDELIDYDTKDRMIMAYHATKQDSKYPDEQIYQYIKAVPLDSPKNPIYLISKEKMPENIMGIKYASESGTLALVGKSLYLYNMNANDLTKIVDISTDWIGARIYNWVNTSLCISSKFSDSSNQTETFLVDLSNKTLTNNDPYCGEDNDIKQEMPYQEKKDMEIKEIISKLRLPESFVVGVESIP